MRKQIVDSASREPGPIGRSDWLPLQEMAKVEVSSEDADHPIESAFSLGQTSGWQAGSLGKQSIRLVFDQPRTIRRIYLRFNEPAVARTQEFALRWSENRGDRLTEIVPQQWNFSPAGATMQTEDYHVDLAGLTQLELCITPDISGASAYASLSRMQIA